MRVTEENVSMTPQQLQLAIIEISIIGRLKNEMHKLGILPLKENDPTSIAANMATVIGEAHRKGTDLKAAFLEAGIMPRNPKPTNRATPTLIK